MSQRSNALPIFDPIPETGTFCRRYGPVKDFDETLYRVTIENGVTEPLVLSLDDLRTKYPRSKVVAALQASRIQLVPENIPSLSIASSWVVCSNNRVWGGVLLRDILRVKFPPGTPLEGLHICFASYEALVQDSQYFGGSIPLQTALSAQEDVLLAFELNGNQLSAKEGGPVRLVAPGFLGARWVKWLDLIFVTKEGHDLAWNQLRAIRDIPLKEGAPVPLWRQHPTMARMPMNTVVASVKPLPDTNEISVAGFGVGRIKLIELSTDSKTWHPTDVSYQDGKWSWTLFNATLPVEEGQERFVYSRATDIEGNTQEEKNRIAKNGAAIDGWGKARW